MTAAQANYVTNVTLFLLTLIMPIREENDPMPTGAMIRAARGLLGIESTQLAEAVGVSRKTVYEIERDEIQPNDERRTKRLRKIRDFFVEQRGVRFLFGDDEGGEGVRLVRRKLDSSPAETV